MNKSLIGPDQVIEQNKQYIASDMNGETVMMNVESGKYYNLGMVGGRIWELSSSPVSLQNIVNTLVAEYDVSYEVCLEQVSEFAGQMFKEGLIEVAAEQDGLRVD